MTLLNRYAFNQLGTGVLNLGLLDWEPLSGVIWLLGKGGRFRGYCAASTVLEITTDGASIILSLLSPQGSSCLDVKRKLKKEG